MFINNYHNYWISYLGKKIEKKVYYVKHSHAFYELPTSENVYWR